MTLILSAPSWVPVFGGRYEDFKAAIVAFFVGFFPVFAIIIGMLIGWYTRGKKANEEIKGITEQYDSEIANIDAEAIKAAAVEKEKREKQEKEEKKALELEQSKIDFIMTLEFESKKILLEILEKGQIKRPSLSRGWEGDAGFASWVKYEPIANGMDRWSLNPWAKEFLDEHPELLECVRVERETREKVEKSIKENGFQQTLQEVGKNIEWNEDGTMKL